MLIYILNYTCLSYSNYLKYLENFHNPSSIRGILIYYQKFLKYLNAVLQPINNLFDPGSKFVVSIAQ